MSDFKYPVKFKRHYDGYCSFGPIHIMHYVRGVSKYVSAGGRLPIQILTDYKAPLWRRAALLLAHPDFGSYLLVTPLYVIYFKNVSYLYHRNFPPTTVFRIFTIKMNKLFVFSSSFQNSHFFLTFTLKRVMSVSQHPYLVDMKLFNSRRFFF